MQKKYDNLNKEYLYLKSKIKINDLSIKVKEIAENEKKVEKLNDEVSILNKEKEALDIKQKESNYIFNEIDKKLSNIAQLRNTKYKELKIKEDELNKIAKGVSPTKLLQSTLEYIEKITKNEKELHDNLNNKKCDFDEKTKIKSSRDGILSQAKKQLEMKEEVLKNLLSKNKFESINLVEKSILPQNIKSKYKGEIEYFDEETKYLILKISDLNKKLKAFERESMELRQSEFKIESKMERLSVNKESYTTRLFEDYDLSYVKALEFRDDSIEINKKILESIKREIASLGNINIDSINEYKETKERYDFYSEQKTDLEESINAIEKIIEELEVNMKVQFKEQFTQVNENFKYVYKRLFGGGEGELTILDEDNILESDIQITAKPPGKKMKNLNLLSGGEKALTAISILFAIILAKPTPFCILDEIEAPLDDANIFRFGEYLKELSEDTQFIAVTHRRGTMEAADYIYGVTMEQKAISKVISLDLHEAHKMTDIV